jgi:hypothetical protein
MAKATDWAWLAGVIDGEGCIVINRQRANSRKDLKTDSFRLYVQITMGCRKSLEKCQSITGFGSIHNHTPTKKNSNPAFCWMSNGREAASILKQIVKYAVTKRSEIDEALLFASIGPWLTGGSNGNSQKPASVVDRMIVHYWRLRMLKPRWRFYKKQLKKAEHAEIKRLSIAIDA